MDFPRAPFDYDAVQPLPPPSSPAGGAPITSHGTVKKYDPEDTRGGWPKPFERTFAPQNDIIVVGDRRGDGLRDSPDAIAMLAMAPSR